MCVGKWQIELMPSHPMFVSHWQCISWSLCRKICLICNTSHYWGVFFPPDCHNILGSLCWFCCQEMKVRFMNKYKLIGHRDNSGFSKSNSVNSGVTEGIWLLIISFSYCTEEQSTTCATYNSINNFWKRSHSHLMRQFLVKILFIPWNYAIQVP